MIIMIITRRHRCLSAVKHPSLHLFLSHFTHFFHCRRQWNNLMQLNIRKLCKTPESRVCGPLSWLKLKPVGRAQKRHTEMKASTLTCERLWRRHKGLISRTACLSSCSLTVKGAKRVKDGLVWCLLKAKTRDVNFSEIQIIYYCFGVGFRITHIPSSLT